MLPKYSTTGKFNPETHPPLQYISARNKHGEIVGTVANSVQATWERLGLVESDENESSMRPIKRYRRQERFECSLDVFDVSALDEIRLPSPENDSLKTLTFSLVAPTTTQDIWTCREEETGRMIPINTLNFPIICCLYIYKATGVYVSDPRVSTAVFRAKDIGMRRAPWSLRIAKTLYSVKREGVVASDPKAGGGILIDAETIQKYPTFKKFREVYGLPVTVENRDVEAWIHFAAFMEKLTVCSFDPRVLLLDTDILIRTDYENLVLEHYEIPFDVAFMVRVGLIDENTANLHSKLRQCGKSKVNDVTFSREEVQIGKVRQVFSPFLIDGKRHIAKAEEAFNSMETLRASEDLVWELFDMSGEVVTPNVRERFVKWWLRTRQVPGYVHIHHRESFHWWTVGPELRENTRGGEEDEPEIHFVFDAHGVATHKLIHVLVSRIQLKKRIMAVVLVGSNRFRKAANEILGYSFYSLFDYSFESKRLPLFPHIISPLISKWSKFPPKSILTENEKDDDWEESRTATAFVEYVPGMDRSILSSKKRIKYVLTFPNFSDSKDFVTAIRRVVSESMRIAVLNTARFPPTAIHLFNHSTFIPPRGTYDEIQEAKSQFVESPSGYEHRITLATPADEFPFRMGVEKITIRDFCDPEFFIGQIPTAVVLCADSDTTDNHVRLCYEMCERIVILVGIPLERAKSILSF